MLLARTLGVLSFQWLMDVLPAEELIAWKQAYHEEPWGELRDDMRGAVHVMWLHGLGSSAPLPQLLWPYYEHDGPSPDDLIMRAKKLRDQYGEHR